MSVYEALKKKGLDLPKASSIDWGATLWAALARNHPHSVASLETSRTTTTRNLETLVHPSEAFVHDRIPYRHGGYALRIVHARNGDLVDGKI
jgi:hypothetical protein